MKFLNNIAELLSKNNMTQRELAEKLNTTEVSISRYVSGDRVPKGPMCIQMAEILGCRVEDLYCTKTETLADSDAEPLTAAEIERFREYFRVLPVVAIPSEDAKTAKVLQEIASELKRIRHSLERRR